MKTCTKCKCTKEESEFGNRYDDRSKLLSWCKECDKARKRESARKRFRDPAKRAAVTRRQKLWTYGLTEDEFSVLERSHNGKCAICGSESPLRIDHDHSTGAVRGLLCHNCNVGLGHFNDSTHLLESAIEYLCKNKSQIS